MKVALIMGSETDLPIMRQAQSTLEDFQIKTHIEIVSAHRTPEKMVEFTKTAAQKGFSIIIAGAGGAAHLPGMVACLTTLPVIGVPIQVGKIQGLDALLSIAQMPKGIPVATVAIDNGVNAGLLAVRILGIGNPKIQKRLEKHQESQKTKVKEMNQRLKKADKKK